MRGVILTKSFDEPPVCKREILRYSGCRTDDGEISSLIDECVAEARTQLAYRVVYRELDFGSDGAVCDFGDFSVKSSGLAKCLAGCERVILFAATIGTGIDRLIAKYSRVVPSRALIFQALGAERIEALCDCFCGELNRPTARFSPGYGDLPLECQREIFAMLDCERKIGLTLNESLLMSPSKSVTAFVGVGGEGEIINKCGACTMHGCEFRGLI